jgi:hypothetical protein
VAFRARTISHDGFRQRKQYNALVDDVIDGPEEAIREALLKALAHDVACKGVQGRHPKSEGLGVSPPAVAQARESRA